MKTSPVNRLMELKWDAEATFVARPNRFVCHAAMDDAPGGGSRVEAVHVHDPGRLSELLYPGNRLLLRRAEGTQRKTAWDLLAARGEGDRWVLVNSGLHRRIVERLLHGPSSPFGPVARVRPEVRRGKSRLDFLLEFEGAPRTWVEVKGCTLAMGSRAMFPDAPTKRGRRHLEELSSLCAQGERAALIILVFCVETRCFVPHGERDPDFAQAFWSAMEAGVEVHVVKIAYDGVGLYFQGNMDVCGLG